MCGTSGRFSYKIFLPEPDKPASASVFIVRQYGGIDGDGDTLLSARLKTEEEIDFCVADLKGNLDVVGRQAKRHLRRASTSTVKVAD